MVLWFVKELIGLKVCQSRSFRKIGNRVGMRMESVGISALILQTSEELSATITRIVRTLRKLNINRESSTF